MFKMLIEKTQESFRVIVTDAFRFIGTYNSEVLYKNRLNLPQNIIDIVEFYRRRMHPGFNIILMYFVVCEHPLLENMC